MDGDTELEADEVERFFGHIVNSYKKRYEWMKIAVDCSSVATVQARTDLQAEPNRSALARKAP